MTNKHKIPVLDAEFFEHRARQARPVTYGTRGLLGLLLVMIAALLIAFLFVAWRVW